LYAPLFTKCTHFILLDFITRMRTGEEYDHEATGRAISASPHSLLLLLRHKYLLQHSVLKHPPLGTPLTALLTLLVRKTSSSPKLN
jgi:hypothetical protein